MVVAYLRVSTNKQHIRNQQDAISRYAFNKGLNVDKWYNDVVSGTVNSRDRVLGGVVKGLKSGDVLIVTEISRLSRSLIDIMNIIHLCLEHKITLHCIKEGYVFEDNLNSKILGFAFGLVAEIERNLISTRTKEALALRRAEGVKLGRPVGSSPKTSILVENDEQVQAMLQNSVPHHLIASKLKVSVCTVGRYVKQSRKKMSI